MLRQYFLTHFVVYLLLLNLCYSNIVGELKICALRVSFLIDEDPSTSGNGKFLSSSEGINCGTLSVDSPPHDRPYFLSQIKAVSAYYDSVSYGKFKIDLAGSEVYPIDKDGSYTLDNSMSFYNPYDDTVDTESRITKLFIDAVEKAYEVDSIQVQDFDLIVIFHAGIGQDFSLPFLDPTPEDIPSTYVDDDMIKNYLDGFDFILNGHQISHGIILPETQNHLNYDISFDMFSDASFPCDYQFGITGTFALMMGFAIGLPPLWNIETGKSGVGIFGLMDQGSNNGRGILPAPPTAWSRIYAGWENPRVIYENNSCSLSTRSENEIIRVDINSDEYFLIENRDNSIKNGISIDSLQYLMWEESGRDSITPYIQILLDSTLLIKDSNNVIIGGDNYDIGLPGSGLLIWHVDESIIKTKIDNFSINANPNRYGVDLEEADGAQDIGFQSIFPFNDPSAGYFGDIWFRGNGEYYRSNPSFDGQNLEFGPNTYPNTNANNNSESNIKISNIGKSRKKMNFSIINEATILNYSNDSIFIKSVYDIYQNGKKQLVIKDDSLWIFELDSNENKSPFHFPESENIEILFNTAPNKTELFLFEYLENKQTKYFLYEFDILSKTMSLINQTIFDDYIYPMYSSENDSLILLSEQEWIIHNHSVKSSTGSYQYDQYSSELIYNESDQITNSKKINVESLSGLDLNGDAKLDILVLDSNGILVSLNNKLVQFSGFPLDFHLRAPILVADVISGYEQEIIAKSKDSNIIYIFSFSGDLLAEISSFDNEKLICVESLSNFNSIVTSKRIIKFGEYTNDSKNYWNFNHGNISRDRYVNIDNVWKNNSVTLDFGYSYPNPIDDDYGTIRIETKNAKSLEIKIYDLAGFPLKVFKRENLISNMKQINEFRWDVQNVESGVYFAIVKVFGDSKIEKVIKIAVLH